MSQISKIGVIGAGNMGTGIAQKLVQEGLRVVLVDVNSDIVEKGISVIDKSLKEAIRRNVISQDQKDNALGRIDGTTYIESVGNCDVVIETIIEDKKEKSYLFEKLDQVCSTDTIIATNTSNMSVNDFAEKTCRPDRFIGMHYFFHPAKNRLIEIIPARKTSKATIDKCLSLANLHGKTPIIVNDSPGFAVNRYFVPSLNESARLIEEGVANIATIEEAYKKAFGIGMGAFELMNVTGVFLAAHGNSTLADALGSFYKTCDALNNQARKNENWEIDGVVDASKIETVIDRLYGLCIGIAATMADEGVALIDDINLGARLGLRWAKGPFELIIAIGIERTYRIINSLAERRRDFKMPKILETFKGMEGAIDLKYYDLQQREIMSN
jgi:enoyl-CoA hydratase / 3-hydroxyacyl-CoA dehydrogenase